MSALRSLLCGLILLGSLVALPPSVGGQDLVPTARAAVLMDQLTGRVLFQKGAEVPIPPASLTKLMTLHLVWKALAAGQFRPGDLVPVTAETTGAAVPPGSSLMFLEPGQQVTVRELMLGLAVDSGNDAGLTLARFVAGDQARFVGLMNAEAQALGLGSTLFFDSYGYDARNRTTARDFAQFCRLYLAAHPQAVGVLHSVKSLAFPLEPNRAPGDRRPPRTIVQENRNTLLGTYPGADGLKTGYIDESGYNLAATAVRNGQRLVAVILGIPGRDSAEGTRQRTAAGARLLDFGYGQYPLRPLPLPPVAAVRVWFGDPGTLVPAPAGPTVYPLSEAEVAKVVARVEAATDVEGPLAAGAVLGKVVWSAGGRDFHHVDLVAPGAVGLAPWWTGAADRVALTFRGLSGASPPLVVSPRR